jgi:hypothetical protein
MPENASMRRNSMNYVSNQKEQNYSSQEQQSKAAILSAQNERRSQSVVREPVNSVEHAMDIALGAEGKPWVERKRTA